MNKNNKSLISFKWRLRNWETKRSIASGTIESDSQDRALTILSNRGIKPHVGELLEIEDTRIENNGQGGQEKRGAEHDSY